MMIHHRTPQDESLLDLQAKSVLLFRAQTKQTRSKRHQVNQRTVPHTKSQCTANAITL
ncbi:hypothetical protein K1T71_014846 [Dendrolimus kikuchii]|nr:hypothetical protein K1T71_014846 [Dendrolimus kikuchii]